MKDAFEEYGYRESKNGRSNNTRGDGASDTQGDTIIFIVVIWMLFSSLFWRVLPQILDNYYESFWFGPLSGVLSLIWGVIPILLTLVVKDKSKQPILFVFGGIYFLYSVYEALAQFIPSLMF